MNYQEWQHSTFSQGQNPQSCQSCHMPEVQGQARVASVLGDYRDGLHRHLFVGGNFLMVRMLNRNRIDLGVQALPSDMEATAKATIRQLQVDTATVSIARAPRLAGRQHAERRRRREEPHRSQVPDRGTPSRRTWLHVTVRDRQGRAVFESGAVTNAGLIQGNDNDADATKYEPHYDQITRPDQVQIYESIMGDMNNVPTIPAC